MSERIKLDLLLGQDNPRPIKAETVARLAASMAVVGLLQAILVKPAELNSLGLPGFKLVAGAHRVAAARSLGWEEIEARVLGCGLDYLETELMEIDENLIRAELSPAQRAAAIKRRREIWAALHPEGKLEVAQVAPPQVGHGGARPQNIEFAADTAKVSGESKSQINRHLARADALGDDLAAVTGTSLDKGVELDALKTLPEPDRRELIARAQTGEVVSARKPMARIRLEIEYLDNQEGAELIAETILKKDPALATALYRRLGYLLKEAA